MSLAGHFSDCCARDNLRGQKSLGPLKMSLKMAHKVIVPPKKNYVPKFLKQRDIGNFMYPSAVVYRCCVPLLCVVVC